MTKSEIETKINDWLQEEEQTVSKKTQEGTEFIFKIDNVVGTKFTVKIVKFKDRDMIQVIFAIIVKPEIKKELLKKETKKTSLISEIQTNYLRKGVQYSWVPNLEEITQIQIMDCLFSSEITKTQLFNSIRLVKDTGVLTLLTISKIGKIDSTEGATSNNQPGVQ